MKRKLMALMIATGLTATSIGDVNAATTGFGLGIHGGYGESKNAESGSAIAGANVVVNVASWLGLVGMVDYKFEEEIAQPAGTFTVTSFPISGMGRLYIPIQSFSPYVAAGVQYRLISYGGDIFDSLELDDSDSSFGWLVGAGAEFNVGAKTELFGEVRYESSDPDQDLSNAADDLENLDYDQWSVRAGLTFFLK